MTSERQILLKKVVILLSNPENNQAGAG